MIDTGTNKCIMHDTEVPQENKKKSWSPINNRQFNGELIKIIEYLNNISIIETHILFKYSFIVKKWVTNLF